MQLARCTGNARGAGKRASFGIGFASSASSNKQGKAGSMAKTSATQFREFQAGRQVEALIKWLRRELRTTHRTDHLDPIIDLVEWLLPQCGGTLQVKSWATETKALRDKVDARRIRNGGDLRPVPPAPTRPTLRVVK